MEEEGKHELLRTLHSVQEDKIPVPDRISMKFFINFYEFIEANNCNVVEATQLLGKVSIAFNTTFITLIPKMDNPTRF